MHNITIIEFPWSKTNLNGIISDRGHLACDLKWRHNATWGIIIFPMMQQISLLEISVITFKKWSTQRKRTTNLCAYFQEVVHPEKTNHKSLWPLSRSGPPRENEPQISVTTFKKWSAQRKRTTNHCDHFQDVVRLEKRTTMQNHMIGY